MESENTTTGTTGVTEANIPTAAGAATTVPPVPPVPPVVAYAGPAVPATRVRIGFLMRLVAAVVDAVFVVIVSVVPTFILAFLVGHRVASIVGGLLGLAYFSLEVFKAQSLGKMIFQYAITAQDGSPATQDQLLKRYLYKQVPLILSILAALPFLGLLGLLSLLAALAILAGTLMALQPGFLAFHDKLFGTAVYGPATVSVVVPKWSQITAGTPVATHPASTPAA